MVFKTGKFSEALDANDNLKNRLDHSAEFLAKVSTEAAKELDSEWNNVSVFVAGSLGRFETGRMSDLDVFLLSNRDDHKKPYPKLQEIRLLAKLIQINESLELPEFSGDGSYLKVHNVQSIVNGTGDANDDVENFFTTRLLLLLESKPV